MPGADKQRGVDYTLLSGADLSRRGFLQSAGILAGGLAVGLVLPAVAAGSKGAGTAAELNAYVEISSDDVISIVVPGAELGQGVYTALPKIIAEELEADWSRVVVRLATADTAYDNPAKKRQSTGNSDGVRGYFDLLSTIGAATREMLIGAAAAQWEVPRETCRASQSRVHHDLSGRSLSYGALAQSASGQPVPEDPPLKAPENYTLLGKSVPRKDGPAKVTGSAVYGADVRLPGQLYASIRTSPVFGGKLKAVKRQGDALPPGVFGIVEFEDGVAVVADSFWEANTALQALELQFESQPNDTWDSAQISAALHAALDDETARAFPGTKGDVKSVLEASPEVSEFTYEVPFLAHVCMEPMTATAQVTETDCTVWAPHQQQGAARELAAQITGLPLDRVSLQGTFCGGGFGRKWELDFVAQAVQIAQQTQGRPVTLMWTREQDVRHDFYRPAVVSRYRAALDDAGNPLAVHARVAAPSVSRFQGREQRIPDPFVMGGALNRLYAIPNKLVDYAETKTHVPLGFWRAVARSHNGFISESFIDELAHLAGRDPLEFRLTLLAGTSRATAVLEKAAAEAGWGRPLEPNTGMGVAFSSGFGSFNAQIAKVSVNEGVLRIIRVTCVLDCGFVIDPDTVRAQMEGGIIDGLSAALFSKVTIADGAVQQGNFDDYRFIRLSEVPEIDVHLISGDGPLGGVGEAAVPAIAPAVANAVFAATGKRIRKLPMLDEGIRIA
ncbi:MAG: isoquinoline 1-oxidoreductase beta subunit [Halieaceae bacterium]|jgi:isoquinoline 1-oxidoreductase beta subunit